VLDQRGQLLRAALGFAGLTRPSYDLPLHALRSWLDSWSGIGRVAVGMARQGYDLQLTRYAERGWRATFYASGIEHSPTSATGGVEKGEGRLTQIMKGRVLGVALCLLASASLPGCGDLFDETYVLWRRYNGPGGNVWRIEEEHRFNVWRSSTAPSNRQYCEKALDGLQRADAQTVEDFKKAGRAVGSTDYVCLPKGMHP